MMGWLGLIATPSVPYWQLIAPMLIAGAGVSMAMPAAQAAVLNAVAPEQIGMASGVFNTGRQLGGAFGVAALAIPGRRITPAPEPAAPALTPSR
ncbi:hypothetical protein NE234_39740 [Actinoallomurus sp. WRP9H-5]|nr:hypothetical protein [Actinoallomurus rhizosphaericola]